jgi:hypothetical protein
MRPGTWQDRHYPANPIPADPTPTRRMESRMAWAKMAALAEFASRPRRPDFAADEVAAAFGVTWLSAAGEIDYARTVKRRLPVTFAALGAGKVHPVHVKIIAEVTGILSDEDAAIADEALAAMAPSKTYTELRRAATRLVLRLDPEAVRKRMERRAGRRGCGRSGRNPATPGSPAGRCPARTCWPPCSTSRSVPARCARPASPAPGRS